MLRKTTLCSIYDKIILIAVAIQGKSKRIAFYKSIIFPNLCEIFGVNGVTKVLYFEEVKRCNYLQTLMMLFWFK
jgi:hypothetical protein